MAKPESDDVVDVQAVKPTRKKKRARSKTAKGGGAKRSSKKPAQRQRVQRSFPAASFEDALELANAMQRLGSERIRRLTLFDELGRSAESGPSRQLVINSGRYELTSGGVQAEWIALTEKGRLATNPDVPRKQQIRARFELAIDGIPPFKAIYDEFAGKKLPSQSVIRDFLHEAGYGDDEIQECIDTFIVNAKFVGLLRTVAGAERLLSLDHVLDEVRTPPTLEADVPTAGLPTPASPAMSGNEQQDWSQVCFYVAPIGADDSEIRQHSDLFLGSLVEPALKDFDLRVVRADQIGKPGMITAQVIEHLANARVVIADLSFHNPNVFYEVALRHACRKPIVQLIRLIDPIPFDLDQFRTIRIDTTDIYTLVPQIETYRSEVATQVRRALEGSGEVENPLTVFYPEFWNAFRSRDE